MIKIYTDGSCRGNGYTNSRGAWGFAVVNEDDKLVYAECGGRVVTTNNQMELEAVMCALSYITNSEAVSAECVEIYTDSAYIHNCVTQGWYKNWQKNGWVSSKKEPVKNKEYWEFLIPYFEDERYSFVKVKGHADNHWNNFVDKMVQNYSLKINN